MTNIVKARLPVLGDSVYGLVLKAVSEPQGNPFGSGLLIRKLVRSGAARVPNTESPFVLLCGNDALMVVIAPNMADISPILVEC